MLRRSITPHNMNYTVEDNEGTLSGTGAGTIGIALGDAKIALRVITTRDGDYLCITRSDIIAPLRIEPVASNSIILK